MLVLSRERLTENANLRNNLVTILSEFEHFSPQDNIEYLVFVVGILVQIAHEICFLATLLLNSLDANVQSNF